MDSHVDGESRTHKRVFPARFDSDEIAEFGRIVGIEHMNSGTLLLRQGDTVDHIGMIASGKVELVYRHGSRRVVLQVLQTGDLYGDIPLLCDVPMPLSARALTDTAVIKLHHQIFWRLIDQRPEMCRRLLFSLASRTEQLQRRLLALTSGDLHHKLVSLLLDQVGGAPGEIQLSQATIAEMLGSTRPSINRILQQFAHDGHVSIGYRSISVTDPEGLRAVLD